ncbi:MAG TPA: cytochrome c peroxidase [Casimicrobiaceae bacterium]|nr:cytochrome c peroxidase [Casimicrobiaceae bacterium]
MRRALHWGGWVAVFALLSACGGGGDGNGGSSGGGTTPSGLTAAAALGEKAFFDPSLSVSGKMSCATCHSPATAHATGDPDVVVPPGGADLTTPGFRNAPSLRYLQQNPAFFFASDGTPTGGFNRDGRSNTLADQARRPFTSPQEMANGTPEAVVAKLRNATYAAEFQRVFGNAIFDDPQTAFDRLVFAVQQYQMEDPEFAPFDSKYDQFLAGRVKLTDRELQGLALFNNPQKGNCAACHPPPLFTDFTYDNLGVPRNADIPANADPTYYDMGLCGPFRTDLTDRKDLCGAFKVPTLRNIAVTPPYFHNGTFKTLKDLVGFYVRRDTNPEEWYPLDAAGNVRKFDDLPVQFHGNVNVTEVPYNRKPGDAPALSPDEIDLLVEFLNTLTDGYQP